MIIKVDTLDYTMKGVLFMEYENRQWKFVAYLSRSLNKMERNYKIHNKDMLATIRELENWKHLLENTKSKFEVQTDYKNLEYFMKAQKLNSRQDCQVLYLSRFNFILKHVSRVKIEKVNRLSRRLYQKVEVEKDNENQKLIKKKWICSLVKVVVEELKVDILEKNKNSQRKRQRDNQSSR